MKTQAFLLSFCTITIATTMVVLPIWTQTAYGRPSPWPMFRHDLEHTARSLYVGPDEPILKWSLQTGGIVYSSPAIGSDGTIYVGSDDARLYALNPDGSLKWSYPTGGSVSSSPAVREDGTIYVGSGDTHLYVLNPDGSLKWSYATDGRIDSSPMVLSWGYSAVGSADNKLYLFNTEGVLRWSYPTDGPVYSSPANDRECDITFVGSLDGKLYTLSDGGSFLWSYPTSGPIYSAPAVLVEVWENPIVYVGSGDAKLYAIDAFGSLLWSYPTGGEIQSSPALSCDTTIYVGSDDNKIYAIKPDGSLLWSFPTDGWVRSSPALSEDGTIYVGSYDGKLYAIGVHSPRALRVPSEYPTIQEGINAAGYGDTVLVADGTYTDYGNTNIDFKGKAILVKSENGPENCIIDCESEDDRTAFYFDSGEDWSSIVEGFTITNVFQDYGSGAPIMCRYSSSPTIRGNIIKENDVQYGGGIDAISSSPRIIGNIIIGNKTYTGGGICVALSEALIKNNLIVNNLATGWGGGIYCTEGSSLTIDGNTLTGNRANGDGGGICCLIFSSATVQNCIIWANQAPEQIYVDDSSEVFVTYSDIQGGWEGEGNIDAYPYFVSSPCGDYYLSQPPCQGTVSPCVDAGDPDSQVPQGSTKSCNDICDDWPVDMGYHYPCLWFQVTPDTQTVERGGLLGYTVEIANKSCAYRSFAYWSDIYLWTGEPYKKNPVFGPKSLTFKPGKKATGHVSHTVPNNAPLKTYTLCGRIGYHAYLIWDEDFFEFTVVE